MTNQQPDRPCQNCREGFVQCSLRELGDCCAVCDHTPKQPDDDIAAVRRCATTGATADPDVFLRVCDLAELANRMGICERCGGIGNTPMDHPCPACKGAGNFHQRIAELAEALRPFAELANGHDLSEVNCPIAWDSSDRRVITLFQARAARAALSKDGNQ